MEQEVLVLYMLTDSLCEPLLAAMQTHLALVAAQQNASGSLGGYYFHTYHCVQPLWHAFSTYA
jgi:hypothetical protein